ncbi:MAG TPA: hypothetical protein VHO69_02780 [Phototrophicaceae bacterium]|nr:hypothetical protein [Phototrophicaceae bacterium]
MTSIPNGAPPPDLRIVLTESLQPHEEHDSQRAQPLIERLQHEEFVINPPIVAHMDADHYVILDGANRFYAFSHLNYPHILVQVADYDTSLVELKTWRHIVCQWEPDPFITQLQQLNQIAITEGQEPEAIAHLLLKDGQLLAIQVNSNDTYVRNAALCDVVRVYQQNAVLHRTALTELDDIWQLHPDALGLVIFPEYQPADIIAAAQYKAYLPPGISRHIIHGRALRVNYPLDILRNATVPLEKKNEQLLHWMQKKLANRHVRYYAEATYQFDE